MLDVLAGPDPRDRMSLPLDGPPFAEACGRGVAGLRIAWSPDLGHADVDPEVARVAREAAGVFGELEEIEAALDDPHDDLELLFATAYAGLRLEGYGVDGEPDEAQLDPGLRALIERGERHSAAELAAAHLRRLRFCDRVRAFMEPFDLLLTPTLPVTAFAAGEDHPPGSTPYRWLPFTYPFNLTGQPALTVPAGLADGLPVGLQIVGRWRDDRTVIAAGAAFERARPWVRPT